MEPKITMLWKTPDPEYQVVRATRICYGSEDKIDSRWVPTGAAQSLLMGQGMQLDVPLLEVKIGPNDEKLLRTIMSNEHNTCLRFASAAFHVDKISRVCSHQLVRLAHFGFLQRSQRYCNEGETEFYIPESMQGTEYEDFMIASRDFYDRAVKSGIKKEDARYLLPNGASTQLNMVSNFQGWKHFLGIRLDKKVQLETLEVAKEICRQLYAVAPIIFEKDMERANAL